MFTYEDARQFVNEQSKFGTVLGLANMQALMKELDEVQNKIKVIHIAGTNGKGSVGTYISFILKEAGLKVARYSSPAVFHELENWQYDGETITQDDYTHTIKKLKEVFESLQKKGISPTVFELETAAAFVYAYVKKADVLLLETGMGGATDATNVVLQPLACVFTTISRDHMQFLGDSIEEIANIKAGIIKPGTRVFSAPQLPKVEKIIRNKCKELHVKQLTFVEEQNIQLNSEQVGKLEFSYCGENFKTQMSGLYQQNNAALAIEVTRALLDQESVFVKEGIAKAKWPGRFEILGTHPLFILDGAHNEDAAKQLAKTVECCFSKTKLIYIMGVLADKEYETILETMLPYAQKLYTITPQNKRGLDGKVLAEKALKYCDFVQYCGSIKEAVEKAFFDGEDKNLPILAFGSLSYLGELKETYHYICESRKKNV